MSSKYHFARIDGKVSLHTVIGTEALCGATGEIVPVPSGGPDNSNYWCTKCTRKGIALGLGR